VVRFGTIGRAVLGCSATPLRGSRFCANCKEAAARPDSSIDGNQSTVTVDTDGQGPTLAAATAPSAAPATASAPSASASASAAAAAATAAATPAEPLCAALGCAEAAARSNQPGAFAKAFAGPCACPGRSASGSGYVTRHAAAGELPAVNSTMAAAEPAIPAVEPAARYSTRSATQIEREAAEAAAAAAEKAAEALEEQLGAEYLVEKVLAERPINKSNKGTGHDACWKSAASRWCLERRASESSQTPDSTWR